MDIAVVGASGDVGRQIAQQVVVDRLLDRDERLVLVGNESGSSARSTYGLAADLLDAYSEITPDIEVVLDPTRIRADLVVVAAGVTPRTVSGTVAMSRDRLADENARIFQTYAQAIAAGGHGHELVICIANPVELAVATFAKHLGRERVVGMGAFLDSLRFRQELATSLGIRRQRIHAFVAGEHGSLAVPLWSGVHIYGYSQIEIEQHLESIRQGVPLEKLWDTVVHVQQELSNLIAAGDVRKAYALIETYPPDVRTVTRPFVTHYSGAKTVIGTARATMEFIRTITQGADALVSGQIALDGDAYGIHGTVGVPFVIGNRGVDRVFELPMDDGERRLLQRAAADIQSKIAPYL